MHDTLIHGDALQELMLLADNSVDSIVTDPPAGVSFMGKSWDSYTTRRAFIDFLTSIMQECLRVLKPGGHALIWALPRTSHWTASAIEDAGFEIRDCIYHLFGSGFPKSHDIAKAIDTRAGAQREILHHGPDLSTGDTYGANINANFQQRTITAPATDDAQRWDGWGTALKPAVECWWLCRKPIEERSVAENVLRWSTGALNIDASRVDLAGDDTSRTLTPAKGWKNSSAFNGTIDDNWTKGRWPSQLLLSHDEECDDGDCAPDCSIAQLDEQSGTRRSGGKAGKHNVWRQDHGSVATFGALDHGGVSISDQGGASRYFTRFLYAPKASRRERNAGCSSLEKTFTATMNDGIGKREHSVDEPGAWNGNNHPTVKSLELMRWLCRLITPPGGVVLDPFAGSGSTLVSALECGFHFIGIEQDAHYCEIARARLLDARNKLS